MSHCSTSMEHTFVFRFVISVIYLFSNALEKTLLIDLINLQTKGLLGLDEEEGSTACKHFKPTKS